jgi:ferritin-like metal-binding protein YciE
LRRRGTGEDQPLDSKTLILQYLDEAHAMETALVTNLGAHIAMTTDDDYRALLERHLKETEGHAKAVDRRRKALGRSNGRGPVSFVTRTARDLIGQALVLSKGPIDGIRTPDQRERMLKNAKDECATEALEIATYDVLETVARSAGDSVTAKLAADHRRDEERMLENLRAEIARLSVTTFESRTGEKAKPQVKSAATRKTAQVSGAR